MARCFAYGFRRLCRTGRRAKYRRNWRARSSTGRKHVWVRSTRVKPRTVTRLDGTLFSARWWRNWNRVSAFNRCWARAMPGRGSSLLVGPPGSGKTTTLVKLAVNYGLASRRPVLLLSVDTYRVAAAEQLRSLRRHSGCRFPGAGNRRRAGAGHRGEPRQGADLHRYARAQHGGIGRLERPGAVSFFPAGHRYATGPVGFHEIRRSISCGRFIRDFPAPAAAVYQAG